MKNDYNQKYWGTTHNFGKHNAARAKLMAYHGISSRSAAKALKYINQFK